MLHLSIFRCFTDSDNQRLAKEKLIEEVSKVEERAAGEEPGAAGPELAEPTSKTPRRASSSSLGSVLDEMLEESEREEGSVSTSAEVQVQIYLLEKTKDRKSNPLHYWKENAHWLQLQPSSSVPLAPWWTARDSFVQCPTSLMRKRNRLSADRVEMLIFLKKNLHIIWKPDGIKKK